MIEWTVSGGLTIGRMTSENEEPIALRNSFKEDDQFSEENSPSSPTLEDKIFGKYSSSSDETEDLERTGILIPLYGYHIYPSAWQKKGKRREAKNRG